MPEMQNTYGNKSGEFASWGDKTSLRYDPKKFFNTGANVINAITFLPVQIKTKLTLQPLLQTLLVSYPITHIVVIISLFGIRLVS